MGQLDIVFLLLLLATASWTVISMTSAIIEAEMYVEVNKLRNDSADGYFNVPEFDPLNATGAYYFYTLMDASKIDHKLIRFVPAVGDYSNSIGNCETHGPAWDVHFIPDFLFWPPIAKRVCDRPCLTHGHRCRPSCCETRCINRYAWQCNLTSFNHYCLPHGLKEVCYEHQNACKCDCAYNHPYCYF